MIDQQMAYTIWKIGKMDNEEFPPLLDNNHLPGPMCMKKLSKFGIFNRLTSNTGYSHKTAISMCGRSNIVNDLIPSESVACLFTAAWVWLGGNFPENIDVIDYGHYRRKPHGHTIRSFRRKLNEKDYVTLGKTRITTPERTICDLAYTQGDNENYELYRKSIANLLISHYRVDLHECRRIIDSNPYFPGSARARTWLNDIANEIRKPWK